ncbi:MAG TPA: helix-turn-helix transcriptional regulator [Armatimonadota bacterium]
MASTLIQPRFPSSPFHCFEIQVGVQSARAAHTHDIHEFVVCINNAGSQFADRVEIPQQRGAVICFPAGMPHHASGTAAATADVYVLMIPDTLFSPESFGDRETDLTLRRAVHLACAGRHPLPICGETAERLLPLAREMVAECAAKEPGYQPATRSLLQRFFLHLMRDPDFGAEARIKPAAGHHDAVARVLQCVDSYFMEPLAVDRMAALAGMSRSHFHAIFREVVGCTLVEYVTRVRIRAAQRLLREADDPIIQIALDCGFPSVSRFYAAFKAITGITPRQARQGTPERSGT